jgi:predicted transcriptional regulator YheO
VKKANITIQKKWKTLLDCIADLLGPRAEVVLHDVSHPDRSIVAIRNGHVTGRKLGAPLTDLGFLMLREAKKRKDSLGVYYSKTETGKQLKCNALVLRDEAGDVEGVLCINLDITGNQVAREERSTPAEHYHTRVEEVISSLIEAASRKAGVDSRNLSSQEKISIVSSLNEQGVFLARGAVKQVSARLGIASPTLYKYIHSARSSSKSHR